MSASAVLCPVCGGKGEYREKSEPSKPRECHGCGGKGWVEVSSPDTIFWPTPVVIPYPHLWEDPPPYRRTYPYYKVIC